MMKHIVFLIAYIYFLYNDFRESKINEIAIGIYGFVALITIALTSRDITMAKFMDMLFSIAFGLSIYLLSYFSEEGIGLADAMFFVINGLLLSLKENIMLFLTGIMVAFIIGLIVMATNKVDRCKDKKIPFMPCILPAVVMYILCIV